MKKNLFLLVGLVIVPHYLVYYLERSKFFVDKSDFLHAVINYTVLLLSFATGVYVAMVSQGSFKNQPRSMRIKNFAVFAFGILTVIYSLGVGLILFMFRKGIGF